MAVFALVTLQPPGYPHTAAFSEIRLLLFHSLRDLGHDVILATNQFPEGAVSIVFGAHLLDDDFSAELPADAILFNTEQLMLAHSAWSQRILRLAEHHRIWDYASANIKLLRASTGLLGGHRLRLGFHHELQRVPVSRNDSEGFVFYGSMSPLRREILARIVLSQRLMVQAFFGIYGWNRDHLLARSRGVLNLHAHPVRLLEWPRILYLVANGIPCISLLHKDTVTEDDQLSYVLAADEADPTPDLENWFGAPDILAAHARAVLERFRQQEVQTSFTSQLLDEAFASGFVPASGPLQGPGWMPCAFQQDPDETWYRHTYHFSSLDPRSIVDYHRQEGAFRQYHPNREFARHFRPAISLPSRPSGQTAEGLRCAVVLHLHSELKAHHFFASFGCHLMSRADFLVTTSNPLVASAVRGIGADCGARFEVRLIENRGRDIPSKYIVFNDLIGTYDLCLFTHGKESDLQWFHDHNSILAGSADRVEAVLDLFARDSGLGLLFPDYLDAYLPNIGWGAMRRRVDQMLAGYGFSTRAVTLLEFPAGGFFWARPAALGLLHGLGLTLSDLPEEPLPLDHTLLHALERMPCLSCEFLGYRWEKIARSDPSLAAAPVPRVPSAQASFPAVASAESAEPLVAAVSGQGRDPAVDRAAPTWASLDVSVPVADDVRQDLEPLAACLASVSGPVHLLHLHHFDRTGYLPLLWRAYLKTLQQAGFSLLVTTCSGFDREAREFLDQQGILAVRRPNRGRCIGAFRETALFCHQLISQGVPIERLILINDSILPVSPHAASLDNLRSLESLLTDSRPVLAGFTDSYERGAHLQSYALAANRSLLLDASWLLFWSALDANLGKHDLVFAGEVGLSVALRSVGVQLKSVYPLIARLMTNPMFSGCLRGYPELSVERLNVSLFLADLLLDEGFAFVKKLALFALPSGLSLMQSCLGRCDPELRLLLAADLDRLMVARVMPEQLLG